MTKSREVRGFEVVTATALRNQKRKLGTIWSKAFQVLQLQYQAGIWSIFDFAVAAQNDENDHEIWRELMMKWEIGAVQVYVCFLLIFRTSLRTTLSRKLVVRPAGQNHFPLFTWGSTRAAVLPNWFSGNQLPLLNYSDPLLSTLASPDFQSFTLQFVITIEVVFEPVWWTFSSGCILLTS